MSRNTLTIITAVVALVLGFGIHFASNYPTNHQTFTGTVTDITETVQSKSHVKLIEVDNQDWYKVSDEWLLGNFRSRDLWGSLEVGETYKFETYGYRIGIFSGYPNVVEAEVVEAKSEK